MDARAIKRKLDEELDAGSPFDNWHGITRANIKSFIVEPYEVPVDPDDLASPPRKMWVVLHENPTIPAAGYVVVFDPHEATWGVAERCSSIDFVLIVSAATMALALESM